MDPTLVPPVRDEIRQLLSQLRPWLGLLNDVMYRAELESSSMLQVIMETRPSMERDWQLLMWNLQRLKNEL